MWSHLVFYRKLDECGEIRDAEVDVDDLLFLMRSPIARCEEDLFDCS